MMKIALQIGAGVFFYTAVTNGIIAGIAVLMPITMSIVGLSVLLSK